ncbi:ATP-binding protein [Shewanella woodyi]|uniref:ATP-binding protein n=1 Tax=Shewanella woodyi TaxID=60961 RepID=UPI003748CCA3
MIKTDITYLSGLLPGITGSPQVEEGQYVTVSVTDSGCGIPSHLLEKIFEPFFTTKDKSKGTGLGLSMVYGFVKRSKGYMSVMKSDEQGTEFCLWFPVTKQAIVEEIKKDERVKMPVVASKLKVLIVDDEVELLNVLKDYCELLGMEVESCNDPLEVRRRYSNGLGDIKLLITDVLMPGGINGYELAKELSADADLSVLLISGFIGDIGINKNEDMPYRVLHKPFDLEGLVDSLEQVGIEFTCASE